MRAAVIAIAMVAGCLDVPPVFRCTENAQCSGGVCEYTGYCSNVDPGCAETQRKYDETAGQLADQCSQPCVPQREICGNGIDDDCSGAPYFDGVCPDNDSPNTPWDITGGGVFELNLKFASVDVSPESGCGGTGGDAFFELTLDERQIVYFRTDSDDPVAVKIPEEPTRCADMTDAAWAEPWCHDASANEGGCSDFASARDAGTYCVLVKRWDDRGDGDVTLTYVPTGRDGEPLYEAYDIYSDARDWQEGPAEICSTSDVPNKSFYRVLACGQQQEHLEISTCYSDDIPSTTLRLLREEMGACVDMPAATDCPDLPDRSEISVNLTERGLYWLILEDLEPSCPTEGGCDSHLSVVID